MAATTEEGRSTSKAASIHECAKIADEAVDLMHRGVDGRQRLGIHPHVAVKLVALARGYAKSQHIIDMLEKATLDPSWAERQSWSLVAQIVDSAAKRAAEDQEAEAKILRTVIGSDSGDGH